MAPAHRHIVLFDGFCNLCNYWVRFLIKNDRKALFRFASLQSETATRLMGGKVGNRENESSVVYIKDGKVFERSDAVLEIAKTLGGFWRVAYFFKIFPRCLRDGAYRVIANNRYRWFGKKNECARPAPGTEKRFL